MCFAVLVHFRFDCDYEYVHIAAAVSVAVVLVLGEVVRLGRWHETLDAMMLRAVFFEPNITAAIVGTYVRTYCCFCCCSCFERIRTAACV